MRKSRLLVPADMDGLYHVVSRVVDRRMIFGEDEKRRFRELLVAYAGFSGIEVVAWCLMDNHFHLLLHVPSRERVVPEKLPEKEVLRRVRLIYKGAALADVERVLSLCVDAESRRRYLEQFTRRMGKELQNCPSPYAKNLLCFFGHRLKSAYEKIPFAGAVGHGRAVSCGQPRGGPEDDLRGG